MLVTVCRDAIEHSDSTIWEFNGLKEARLSTLELQKENCLIFFATTLMPKFSAKN